MNQLNVCQNRPQKQRVSLEVCKYHIQEKDRVCLKRLNKILVCQVARQIVEGKNAE